MLSTIGEHFRIPLLREVGAGEIAFTVLSPGQAPPLSKLDATRLPSIIVLVDDDDVTRFGPGGWPHAARVMRWTRATVLHAAGGLAEHYDLAVHMAKASRRLVIVECGTATVDAWTTVAMRSNPSGRILRIQPLDGSTHPIATPREVLQ